MEKVDFYVLSGTDERERWKFACRVIDKAFEAEQHVLVWLENADAVARFDDLLWTFAQDSFVPHEPLGAGSDWEESPVLLSSPGLQGADLVERAPPDVIVNLAAAVPPAYKSARHIIEIIDAEPVRRESGRARFRQYRTDGVEPTTTSVA